MTYQCYNMETLVSIESLYFKSVVLQFLPSVLDLILHLVIMCPWSPLGSDSLLAVPFSLDSFKESL